MTFFCGNKFLIFITNLYPMVIGLISSTLNRNTSIIERGVDRDTFNVKFRPTLYSMAWYCFKFQGDGWLLFSLYVWPAHSRQAGVNTIMSSKILRCMLLSSKNKQMLIETRNHFKKICEVIWTFFHTMIFQNTWNSAIKESLEEI